MRTFMKKVKEFSKRVKLHHVDAYAAQSAFFLMLSLIPIILLLLTLVRFTPLTKSDVLTAVYDVFPSTIRATMISVVNEVYTQSVVAIPLTILVTMWSAGRGVMAITKGLNSIHDKIETGNFVFVRIRAAFYTVLFIVAIVLTLVVLGFGNSISLLVNEHIPIFQYVIGIIIQIRAIIMMPIIVLLAMCVYRFLPNCKVNIRYHIPGALFTAIGWTFTSFLFSVYMDIFKGFSNIYGSLTTIILIMLWLYFCMYIMLLGAEINVLIEEYLDISQ